MVGVSRRKSSWKRPLTLFARAVRLRCPNCGGRPLFKHWLRAPERCPVCGIRLARGEEGYEVGAYMFNIVMSELIFAAIFLAIVVATWPAPPWDWLLYGGVLLMLIEPADF
jgi:uncharacterized protein (DUF983 family)